MKTLNLGILAHVDAGKTSLTERLLFTAGVIDAVGRVDDGNTQTDSLALERQRGITIKSAVVSFVIDDTTVNLIDTPGHPDFIAEVERVLNVLDGAVLVISAVEGVQAQTRILMRTLQRLGIPTLIFINKIDRGGAQDGPLLERIARKLSPSIIPMAGTDGLGTRNASAIPFGEGDPEFLAGLTDLLTERDDRLLADFVRDGTVPYRRLRSVLAEQSRRALVHPVYFGSAMTGAGIAPLMAAIPQLLPASRRPAEGPVSGTVFKVERGAAGEKVAYVRLFGGTVRTRDRLPFGAGSEAKVTAIRVFENGGSIERDAVRAGQIARLWGLSDIQIGDGIGTGELSGPQHYFAPPTLETVVVPARSEDKGPLRVALAQLAEQDPLINLRQDDIRQEIYVSLYGEVQKEVVQTTLAADFGLEVSFRETTTICIERPVGTGAAAEFFGTANVSTHQSVLPVIDEDPNPFLATVGLRIEPGPVGSGVQYRLSTEVHGTMPPAFFKAVEETVRKALLQGIHGWQVIDCIITLTHTGYVPRQGKRGQSFNASISSSAGDFRNLTPLVLMTALKQAGTAVCEPMHRFHLEIPEETFGAVLPVLGRLGAAPRTPQLRGPVYELEGDVPAANVHELQQLLPGLTHGEGVFESAFDHYEPARGEIPDRQRTDQNPLDRKEYLLNVARRLQPAQLT